MKRKEKRWIRFRIYLAAGFFLFGLGAIVTRAYQLQVLERDRLRTIAQEGYIGTIKLPPQRGIIYDREGHELALSVEAGSVYAHPPRIQGKAKTAAKLSKILELERKEVLKRLSSGDSFVWIKRRIPPRQAGKVKEEGLKGVGIMTETKRYYPGKEIAAHLIGFVGTDNQGLEGVERKYDQLLRGSEYRMIKMHDALGRLFSISKPVRSGKGMHNLFLTIDKDLQYRVQQALEEAVRKREARSGQCLVVDPETGEILAMAVVPEFNPNIFSQYRPEQWRNRILTDCFEPGSTLKAFLLAASLEEAAVSPLTLFDCEEGKYRVSGYTIGDAHEHGVLSVSDIVTYSSNIGAIKIGGELGYDRFHDYLQKFGFGTRTGVGLLGEREGFIRPPSEAGPVERATAFFGQGMTTTSLQLAVAMSAIANGGRLMRPYVVKSIVDESGDLVKETSPRMVRRVISERTARRVTRILERVVSEEGTGTQAAIGGFRVAGKTGTAQKVDPETGSYSRESYVATFVGFVPVDRPELLILVVIDEPRGVSYGGVVAAPVFSEIGHWALNHLGVSPGVRLVNQESGAQAGFQERGNPQAGIREAGEGNREGVLPDFTGLAMREVMKKGRALGLKVCLEGTGLAVKQDPGPGSALKNTSSVRVSFKPPRDAG